jgi:hypothetical protein
MRLTWQSVFVIFAVTAASGSVCQAQFSNQPWATCHQVDGKGGESCDPGDRARPFKDFLEATLWAQDPHIGSEVSWDLSQLKDKQMAATWIELGAFRTHRVRLIHFASWDIVLAERNRGIFSPLMKWAGAMPKPTLLKVGSESILVMAKDFGGNVPMVETWAWVWGPSGPVRLDVEGAIQSAIEKVAPGHGGYSSGIDWRTKPLHAVTWTWAGDYPGKVGVGETVNMWFELKRGRLMPTRVEFENYDGDKKIWKGTDK